MNFEQLNSVIKFGRAPEQGMRAFWKNYDHRDNFNPHHNDDLVLADYLGDHDDPREHIVRGDLHIRSLPGDHWFDKLDEDRHQKLVTDEDRQRGAVDLVHGDTHYFNIPDGTYLSVGKVSNGRSRDHLYTVGWNTGTTSPIYNAHLTPEQTKHLLETFGHQLPDSTE